MPARARPGSPASDAPTEGGWLLDRLGDQFQLLAIGVDVPATLEEGGITIESLSLAADESPEVTARYLGDAKSAVYLMRPDQHVAARWIDYDEAAVRAALKTATSNA